MPLAGNAVRGIGAAQRDALIDGHIVANLGRLTDYGETMVDEEVFPDLGTGMNVDRGEKAGEMIDAAREEIEARAIRRCATWRKPSAHTPG